MGSSADKQKARRSIDLPVPAPLSYLKSLRRKADRQSLYQGIILGGSFIEGLGLLWFKRALDQKGLKFDWKDTFPPIEMRHVLALMNGAQLIDDREYGRFVQAAQYRNKVVHRMFSQWVEKQDELETMADEIISCLSKIVSGLQQLSAENT
jgi:hypothetical protein